MAFTDIHFVVFQRQAVLLQELLEVGGVDLEARQHGLTPLMVAAGGHRILDDRAPKPSRRSDALVGRMLTLLIEAGARIDAGAEGWPLTGRTALHFCCSAYPANAEALISARADVNASSFDGLTPLMCAAHHAFLVRRLLAAGSDPFAVDARGRSALFYAGSVSSAKLLVRAGLSADLRDVLGRSPSAMAADRGLPEVAAWLASRAMGKRGVHS